MAILIILFILVIYVLFLSRSKALGKRIYHVFMTLEKQLAGLEAQTIIIDDVPVTLYVSEHHSSSRPTLLLLHGFSADKTIWHRFARQAKHDYNLIIPDMLGHGDTPYFVDQSYSTHEQTKMLIKLIDSFGLADYSVVGNSMGGMIAMQLMHQDSQRIDKAVLLDPAGIKSNFAIEMQTSGINPFLHIEHKDFMEFYERSMHKRPFVPPSVLHYIGKKNYLDRYQQLAHMFADFFNIEEFFDDAFNVALGKLKIVWGEVDRLLPVTETELWTRYSGCQVHIYVGVGHMPMVEIPRRCFLDTKRFLQEN